MEPKHHLWMYAQSARIRLSTTAQQGIINKTISGKGKGKGKVKGKGKGKGKGKVKMTWFGELTISPAAR